MKSITPFVSRSDRGFLGELVLVSTFAVLACAQPARSELGDLTPEGCIQETGGTSCNGSGGTAPGLDGALAVAVSPDGDNVYVVSSEADAVAIFDRDNDGSLTASGCFQEIGGTDCLGSGGTTPGLDGASDVAVSPDGKSVYVTSNVGNALVEFTRATDGSLTPGECFHDSSSSLLCDGGGVSIPGLRSASAVTVSPDGENVYVASLLSDAVAIFDRAANGSLTPAGCIQQTGGNSCMGVGGNAPGLDGANDIAVSPDGDNVYVASNVGDSIAIFDRAADGSLTSAGCIEGPNGIECVSLGGTTVGLDSPRAVAVSSDGDNVYVVSQLDDAVVTFDRAGDGSLTPAGCIQDTGGTECGGTAPGLDGARALALSAGGDSLYVASVTSDAVAVFDRAANGSLSFEGCIQDTGRTECTAEGGSTTQGLEGAAGVALSPGGTSAYVTAFNESTVVVFGREAPVTTTTTVPPNGVCGDASGNGSVSSNDALAILKAAVGGDECDPEPCLCDVAGGGSIQSSDALAALRIAVGLPVDPKCTC